MSAVYNDRTTADNPLYIFTEVQGSHLAAYDPPGLAHLSEAYPDPGMRHLYRKAISSWLRPVNRYLFTMIDSIAEEEYPRDGQAGLVKAIYLLDPERPFRGVDGGTYRTPDEIAECLERNFDHYEKELQSPTAPLYLYLEARGFAEEARSFRSLFGFDVILVSPGKDKTRAARAVSALTKLDLVHAYDLVEGAPQAVLEKVDKKQADDAAAQLSEAGATVSVKSRPPKAALNSIILSLQSAETGPVLKLGKFVAAEPREILLAEQSIQERVAQDLADPYSKVSLWLQHFPHLAGSVARYRTFGRSGPERLLTALSKSAVEKKKRREAMGVQEVSAQ